MYYCVAYDISSNRLRLRVVKLCKQAGLLRLQKSVFAGRTAPERMADFEREARALLPPTDRLCIIPLDAAAWQSLLLFGQNPPKHILARLEAVRYF